MRILPPGRTGGFTLFEIIIVLVIMGTAAAVVIPSFVGGLSGIQMETATRDLITCMRRARSDAVTQQKTFRVVLKSNPDGISRYILADDYQKLIKDFELPKGISFTDQGVIDGDQVISFYSNGRSSGGSFILKNKKGKKIKVEIDPITGFGKMVKNPEAGSFR